jgi:hypothetical protein
VERCQPDENALERLDGDRPLPVEQRSGQVRHEDPVLLALDSHAEVWRPHGCGQIGAMRREPGLPRHRPIPGRLSDPVVSKRIALQDEAAAITPAEERHRCAGPAIVRKRLLVDVVETVACE